MQKSSKSRQSDKPPKPYPDYPLFAHASGRWAKKILGKLHYFGRWGHKKGGKIVPVDDVGRSAQDAVDLYSKQREDLHAGRTPRDTGEGLTVRDLCNRFLTAKRHLVDTHEIKIPTFQEYHGVCEKIVSQFGPNRLVEDLGAEDFSTFRVTLAVGRGPVSLGKDVRLSRMVFKYATDFAIVSKPIQFGPAFKAPSKKVLRQARKKNGKRMLEADEIRSILDSAKQPLHAMTLLEMNCGFGQHDCATLPQDSVDLKGGWIDFPRPKTAIERRVPLWPETVASLEEAINARPSPNDEADDNLVFVTRFGQRWVRVSNAAKQSWADSVCLEFGKLLKKLELKRPGLNFYALRHTFETIAGESADQVAVNAIMGHADNSMAAVYRERISDERLQAVVDVVRAWLWPEGV